MSAEQLLEEARKDVTKTQQRIDGFFKWFQQEKGMRESSAFIVAYGYLRGFFSNHDIPFQKRWSRSHKKEEGKSEAIANDDVHYSFFSPDKEGKAVQFNSDAM